MKEREKWFIKGVKSQLNTESLPTYLRDILQRRGVDDDHLERFLNPSLEAMHSPIKLPDCIKGANLVMTAIEKKQRIRVVGDYDVDGVTATYILVRGLQILGANVDYVIPHRKKDGYGISEGIIDEALSENIDLIVTCDNGIAAADVIEKAIAGGMRVVVTDHHEVPHKDGHDLEPPADAIINPKLSRSKYPFSGICGAVVAYKFMAYLFMISGQDEAVFQNTFLPFAAIGTVCDVMELVDENRAIVALGLERLNQTEHIGLRAIKEACDIKGLIDAYHIGFIIGPTINSSGRLDHAARALDVLFEMDYTKALELAQDLRELNRERQKLTEESFEKVDGLIQQYHLDEKLRILIVKEPCLDESIIGIVAGRIKEKYHRPSVIITQGEMALKGSGRSIEAYDMFSEFSRHKALLQAFGGHKMACGLSIEADKLKEFIVAVNNAATLTSEDMVKEIRIDTLVRLNEVSQEMVQSLEQLKPFGNGNPKPLMVAKGCELYGVQVLGKNQNVIKFILRQGQTDCESIYFRKFSDFKDELCDGFEAQVVNQVLKGRQSLLMDVVFTPTVNEFRDKRTLQLKVTALRASKTGDKYDKSTH
ncbi:single-stranded-DNA-specific exonuclease RecJ [Peptoniphilus equinus]|uniref:Single-stranded-DNA-specific exonuclease RecJ n=1 Tax=Peptoniphilus equinus TaxID=3016343 RepID=A0ABY7QW44_9FIRM|nr:single-stranded-DNA-specific exonuclease RecJ [Peptoniphilus equinus]WBW50651.1 single-stranded-DNA-specific exonuclease RecJ [Peptoniphilus equinus]